MSIVWVTSTGPSHRANKLGVIRWMGTSIVRVDLPQMKSDGQTGGKLPGSESTRRRRGSRGRRTGRARVGKTRSLARAAARESANKAGPVKKGTRASHLAKARLRRAKWIESRFTFIGDWLKGKLEEGNYLEQTDGTLQDAINFLSGSWQREKVKALFWLRLKQLSDNFRRKGVPCGPWGNPGRRPNTWGWFCRFWEFKYGTWEDVSWLGAAGNSPLGPMGLLSDGFHMYPRRVLNFEAEYNQREDSRSRRGSTLPSLTARQRVELARSNARRVSGADRPVRGLRSSAVLTDEERQSERKRLERVRRG